MTQDPDEIEALRRRVAELEAGKRRGISWGKVAFVVAAVVFALLILAQATAPRTYGDIANEDAADCVRSGNDGRWFPGDGNLQDVCRIRADVKAIQQQAVDAAQPR